MSKVIQLPLWLWRGDVAEPLTPYLRGDDGTPTQHEVFRVKVIPLADDSSGSLSYLRPAEVSVFYKLEGLGVYEALNDDDFVNSLPPGYHWCPDCGETMPTRQFARAGGVVDECCAACSNARDRREAQRQKVMARAS